MDGGLKGSCQTAIQMYWAGLPFDAHILGHIGRMCDLESIVCIPSSCPKPAHAPMDCLPHAEVLPWAQGPPIIYQTDVKPAWMSNLTKCQKSVRSLGTITTAVGCLHVESI